MRNFEFVNPTKLVFGNGTIARLADLIPADKKIMITFGGGSVKSNGVYDEVKKALKDHQYVEFWGIEPNPKYETLLKAIKLGREENIDMLLAVGGGSVVDGTKFIAAAIPYTEGEEWDLIKDNSLVKSTIPLADVITLPATGSEMNNGAVISREATKEKYAFFADTNFPVFSILDPEVTYSLPKFQIACGVADTFVHVVEQYLTIPVGSKLMDRWAEGILQTLVEIAPELRKESPDYDTMSEYMLSATMGLNGFIAMGAAEDWTTHMIGHELTALHGLTHAVTLAIVYPAVLRVMKEQKMAKLLQYGKRVWGVDSADAAIERTESFFRELGLPVRLNEVNAGDDTIEEIVRRFRERNVMLGECGNITPDMVRQILITARD
ncbi:MAG: iron-containing alcohol dehydrogenase [Bacteroidales bacterium]